MADKARAVGALYMWPHYIEASDNILSNPHYSFYDAEGFTDRYIGFEEREFLKEDFLEEVDTEAEGEHYQLTEHGREVAYNVYHFVEENYNGNLQQFIDWEDEEKIDDLLS